MDSQPREVVQAQMIAIMHEKPTFTFTDLWKPYGCMGPQYRWADRLIQRERKAGRIRMTNKHGVWEVVK